jgi:N utilization substance protein B
MPRKKSEKAEPLPPEPVSTKRPPGSAKARRTAARLAAVQSLYQVDLVGVDLDTVLKDIARHREGLRVDGDHFVPPDPALLSDIARGALAKQADIDALLARALDKRELARHEPLIRAILRAGAFELLAHGQIDTPLIITEYVHIADGFYDDAEVKLINAVLDRVGRTVRADG